MTFLFLCVIPFIGNYVNMCGDRSGEHSTMAGRPTTVSYSRNFLMQFSSHTDTTHMQHIILPREMKRRQRGKRGGVRQRLKKRAFRPPLPSIILANTRSVKPSRDNTKLEELQACVRYLHEYRNVCVLCLTETWLVDYSVPNSVMCIDGFGEPFRLDREESETNKKRGGGVAIYINSQWCSQANVRERLKVCTKDAEVLCVSCRPKYLPREFGQVFLIGVYIHPGAHSASALATVAECVHDIESKSPGAPCVLVGDFNRRDVSSVLPAYHQFVTCGTRKGATLDCCWANIAGAYSARALAPVGGSDHKAVHLRPAYRPVLKRGKVEKRVVKTWTPDAVDKLKGCFECTDWEVLISSDIDESVTVVTDYIKWCEQKEIPEKTVKIYPNTKPWVSKEMRNLAEKKREAYLDGKESENKNIQKDISAQIKRDRANYKDKTEAKFREGNMRDAWKGLKVMSGQHEEKDKTGNSGSQKENAKFVSELNDFYCRFDKHDFKAERDSTLIDIQNTLSQVETLEDIDPKVVEKFLIKIDTKKAPGPDNLGGKVLKECAQQLASIFAALFNMSLKNNTIPDLWKQSTICPIPKKRNPAVLNDYRPVALTPIIMKVLERIVLQRLMQQTDDRMDPHQFAYRRNRGVEDAIISLLHDTYTHLESPKSFVRVLYIDFSSAFNTIQPHLMARKLVDMQVNPNLILWLVDFLVERSQKVKYQHALSDSKTISTGAPQGTVLAPVLFTLYTNDMRTTSKMSKLYKYSDDSALTDFSESDEHFDKQVKEVYAWCQENYLELNVGKTKEMVIESGREKASVNDLKIDGKAVERVDEQMYLGTLIDNKLSFNGNTKNITKKCNQRLYCLHRLRSFDVSRKTMQLFYNAFILSILSSSFLCWFGNLTVKNRAKLNSIVNKCSKIVGVKQLSLNEVYERRVRKRAKGIIRNESHPLAVHYQPLPSGRRLRSLPFKKTRTLNSFVPVSIKLMNKS